MCRCVPAPERAVMAASTSKCSVCLELFTEPKVLPCCHTFCLQCLKSSKKTQGTVSCPQCRQPHPIPAGGLTEFLTDFIATDEVEVVGLESADNTIRVCGECEQKGPVTSFCTECQDFLCVECNQLHKKVKAYRSHKVVPKDEVNAAALQRSRVHHCAVHNAEVLKLYCKTCEKLVCRDCTLVDHREHSYTFVHDARNQIEAEMKSLQSEVEEKLAPVNQNLTEIKKIETAVLGHPQVLKADINAFFDDLVKSIEARRTALLKQAEKVCARDLKQVTADKKFHEITIAQCRAVFALAAKAVECSNDSEMIATSLHCISQLRVIKDKDWDGHSFVRTVLSTPTFEKGDNDVNKFGSVDCSATQSFFHLELINNPYNQGQAYSGFVLRGNNVLGSVLKVEVAVAINAPTKRMKTSTNEEVGFEIPTTQSLTDRRSGQSITIHQSIEPDLKMVVCYGHSGKQLDDSRITVKKNAPACGYGGQYGGGFQLGVSGAGGQYGGGLQLGVSDAGGQYGGGLKLGASPALLTGGRGSHQVPTQQLVVIASYIVSIRLMCSGSYAVTFKFGGSELNHSFTVVGQPQHGSQVKKGPDWKPHLSALPHPYTQGSDSNVIGTVIHSGTAYRNMGLFVPQVATGFGVPAASSVPQEAPQGMVNVNEGSGIVGQYKWGKDDKYEIELA